MWKDDFRRQLRKFGSNGQVEVYPIMYKKRVIQIRVFLSSVFDRIKLAVAEWRKNMSKSSGFPPILN